jgi:nitrate/nitrite transporter NarK
MDDRQTEAGPARLVWPFQRVFYGWAVAGTAFVTSFATVPMYGPVLSVWVKPISEDTGWSLTEISLAFTIGSITGSMLTGITGRILDRHGARAVTVISSIVVAIALVGLTFMAQPWHMWLFFGIGRGASIAGVQFGTTIAIANWFVRQRGKAMAIAGIGLRLGQALVPLMVLPIMLWLSWRHAYGVLAVAVLLLAVLPAYLFIRRRPEDYGMRPDGVLPTAELPPEDAERMAHDEAPWTVREALHTRALWLVLLTMSSLGFAQTATNLHAVASFQERGVSFAASTTIVVIFAGTSALTTYPWGLLVDRFHIRPIMMASAVLYMLAMVIIANVGSYAGAVAFGIVFGTAAGAWTLGFRLLIPNYFGRRSAGGIRGATAPFTAFIGPMGPTLAGITRDVTGTYTLAFSIFAVVFAVAFVAMMLARPPTHPSLAAKR